MVKVEYMCGVNPHMEAHSILTHEGEDKDIVSAFGNRGFTRQELQTYS